MSHPGFPGISVVKSQAAMQKMWVQYLGWEDSLENKMATHSSILAWESCTWKSLAGYCTWRWTRLSDKTTTTAILVLLYYLSPLE